MKIEAWNVYNSAKIEVRVINITSVQKNMLIGSVNNSREIENYEYVEKQAVHIYECNSKYHFIYLREQMGKYIEVGAASCNKDCNPKTVARGILENASELF